MKTLGLIGGMSWESTVPYYRMINEHIKHDWHQAGELLGNAARSLARAGADVIVVCTNTMHKVAGDIERIGGLPLLHIADATAGKIKAHGLKKIGLLGTRFTMEQDFYRGRLQELHQIDVVTPDAGDRDIIHRIIYEELCLGIIRDDSREEYRRIIASLEQQGVEGIIFGCTEITLLVGAEDADVPVFDTTAIHALAAAQFALKDH
jgi:aspartate racemase